MKIKNKITLKKNIVVTGGAGFIGSNLVDKLVKENYKVIVIDNFATGQMKNLFKSKKKIKILKADVYLDKKKLFKYLKNVDCIFHLAGLADIVPSINDPIKYFNVNVLGTLNILEAARKNNIKKIIYAASASCYGIPKKYPTRETDKIKTEYPYATTKYLGEKLILDWAKIYNMKNSSLRLFNVYGRRSRTTGAYGAVFGVFLSQKLSRKPLTIVGNGKQTRDFVHVDDVVSAFLQALKFAKPGSIFNIGSGRETTINHIAGLISNLKTFIPKRPGEPDRSLAYIEKTKKILKWSPKVKINDGVNNLLKNLTDYKNAPLWTPKKIKKATKIWFKYLK